MPVTKHLKCLQGLTFHMTPTMHPVFRKHAMRTSKKENIYFCNFLMHLCVNTYFIKHVTNINSNIPSSKPITIVLISIKMTMRATELSFSLLLTVFFHVLMKILQFTSFQASFFFLWRLHINR